MRPCLVALTLLLPLSAQDTPRVTRHAHGTLVVQHGLHVLRLTGDRYEVARAHVELLGETFRQGYFPVAATKVERALAQVLPAQVGRRAPAAAADALLFGAMALGAEDEATCRGVAEASGFDLAACRRAFLGPDAQHVLVALAARLHLVDAQSGVLDTLGCSSAVVWGERTASGERLFGRNQDYPGIGRFDRFPCVSFVTPAGGHRYVAVAPAGLVTGGITGMNEHGLALALHAVLTTRVRPSGLPILTIAQHLLERCRDLDEVLGELEANAAGRGFCCGWLIHLTDRKAGQARAAVVELDGEGYSVRWAEHEASWLANQYRVPERREGELHPSFTTSFHSTTRARRLGEIVAGTPRFDAAAMAALLRDRVDPTCGKETSYSPWIVAAVDQTKAAIFAPDARELWVAVGGAPVTAGRWAYLTMAAGFAGAYEREGLTLHELGDGAALWRRHPGYRAYLDAYVAWHEGERDAARALARLRAAAAAEDAPYYRLGAGVLAVKGGDLDAGMRDLEAAIAHRDLHPHHARVARFVLALAHDARGERDAARALLRAVAGDPEAWPALRHAATSWLDAPCPRAELAALDFHLKYLDCFRYPTRPR